jgi:hypothetical protein
VDAKHIFNLVANELFWYGVASQQADSFGYSGERVLDLFFAELHLVDAFLGVVVM